MGSKRTKRFGLECLERRNLLSAAGLPILGVPNIPAPPALIGSAQPGGIYPADNLLAGLKSPEAPDTFSPLQGQVNMPAGHEHDAASAELESALNLQSLAVLADSGANFVATRGHFTYSQAVFESPAGSPIMFADFSGQSVSVAVSDLPTGTAVSVDSTGVAFLYRLSPDEAFASAAAAALAAEEAAYYHWLIMNAGLDGNSLAFGELPDGTGDYSEGSLLGQNSGSVPNNISYSSIPYSSPTAGGPDARAAAHNRAGTVSRDDGSAANGLATDGNNALLASFPSPVDSTTPGNAAETAFVSYIDDGFAVIDRGSSTAQQSMTDLSALSSSDGGPERLGSGVLASDVAQGA